jgi:hypothetical protein
MKFREYLENEELKEQKKKSEAAEYVLSMMDSEEDGQSKFEVYVKQALKKFPKVKEKELLKELDYYI